MYCPKCGKENPDDAKSCSSCGAVLTPATERVKQPIVKTSGLAITSLVLGILSPFTFGITIIPAIVLGIISLVTIEKSGGKLTGRAFAVLGIVIPVFAFFVIVVLYALTFAREGLSPRMICGSNLSGIGKAMLIYANDYEGQLPRAGGIYTCWAGRVNWDAPDRFQAYSLFKDGSHGVATISSSLYLLVKYAEVTPKSFVCKGDSGTTEFRLSDYPNRNPVVEEYIHAWDFGPEAWKHCSYSYHMPYCLYFLTTSSEPSMAVAADRNPWIRSPAADFKDYRLFKPDIPPWNGTVEQAKFGNAITHNGDGQNVLFMDSHVSFEKRPYCGIENDNIYTYLPQGIGHPQLGEPPVPFASIPGHRKDSFLVHDLPLPAEMRPPIRRPRRQ